MHYLGLIDINDREVQGCSYCRQLITWENVGLIEFQNDATVTFPAATGNWGDITKWVLFATTTSSKRLFSGALNRSLHVSAGTLVRFGPGGLVINGVDPELVFIEVVEDADRRPPRSRWERLLDEDVLADND